MKRPYELKERGARQDETRQKIVEAAIYLHQRQGIAATSMLDIAEQAGVGKVTVYRHFPDLDAMAGACSGLYFERNPPPDPTPWGSMKDPAERLRLGLADTYAWFSLTKAMMLSVYPEARDHPVMATYHTHWKLLSGILLAPWKAKGRDKTLLQAAIALALDFDTWRTLTQVQGLTDQRAVDLMLRLTCDCLQDPYSSTRK